MQDEGSKPRPDKTLRWMIGILVAVVVLVGGYLLYRRALANGVEKRLDAIRAQGYPVTLQELDDWYPTPPVGENAADVYQQAFLKFAARNKADRVLHIVGTTRLPELGEPIAPKMLEGIADYLARNQEALDLLHKAAAYRESRYPVNILAGHAMPVPHLINLRQAARLLYLEAILATERSNAKRATRAVLTSLALGRSVEKEPTVTSWLLGIVYHGYARESLERMLSRMPLTDAQLKELGDAFKAAYDPDSFTRALAGERCMGIAIYRNPAAGGTLKSGMPSLLVLQFIGMLDMDQKEYLDIMNAQIGTATQDIAERRRIAMAASGRIATLPKWYQVSRVVLPRIDLTFLEDLKCAAYLRVTYTALAVERYRTANEELPDYLAELVPAYFDEVPLDPFADESLRYKRTKGGYVVYSVGRNGKDDGGAKRDGRGHPADLPFRVERQRLRADE